MQFNRLKIKLRLMYKERVYMEQNMDLFYKLCNKYGVEMSDKANKTTVKTNDEKVIELTKSTSKEILKDIFGLS